MKSTLSVLSFTVFLVGLSGSAWAETVQISGATIEVQDVNAGKNVTEAVLLKDADLTVDGNTLPLKRGTEIRWWNEIKALKRGTLRQNTTIEMAGRKYNLAAGSTVDCSSMSKKAEIHTVKLTGDHAIPVYGGVTIQAGPGNVQFGTDGTIANVFGAKVQELELGGHKIKTGAGSYVGFMDGWIDKKKELLIWNFQPSQGKPPQIELWGQMRDAENITFKRGKTRLERAFFRGGTAVQLAGQDATVGKAYFNALGEVERVELYRDAKLKIDGKEQDLEGGGTSAFSKGTPIYVTPDLRLASLSEDGLAKLVASAPTPSPTPAATASPQPQATPGKVAMGMKRGPAGRIAAPKGATGKPTPPLTAANVVVKIAPNAQLAKHLKSAGAGSLEIAVTDLTGKQLSKHTQTVRAVPKQVKVQASGFPKGTQGVVVKVKVKTIKKQEYRGQVELPLAANMTASVTLRPVATAKLPPGLQRK